MSVEYTSPADLFGIDELGIADLKTHLSDQLALSDLYRLGYSLEFAEINDALLRRLFRRTPLDRGAAGALYLPHPVRDEYILDTVLHLSEDELLRVDCSIPNCPCRQLPGCSGAAAKHLKTGWTADSQFLDRACSGHYCVEIALEECPGYLLVWLPPAIAHSVQLGGFLNQAAEVFSHVLRYKELQQARELFLSVLEQAADCIEITDEEAVIEYVNPAFERTTGYSKSEAIGKTVAELLRPPGADETPYQAMRDQLEAAQTWKGSFESLRKDRSEWIVEATLSPIFNDRGEICNHIAIKRDITENVRLYQKLSRSERRYRNLMEQAADAFFVHDLQGRLKDVNKTACDSLGYTRDECLQLSVEDIEQDMSTADLKSLWNQIQQKPVTTTGIHRRKDGTTFPVELRLGVFDGGDEKLVLAMARNIARRKILEEQLVRQANYDSLTGLPNRHLAYERLKNAISRANRSLGNVAVIFLDLDGFKKVNDTLGHIAGDRLLKKTASRLQACIRDEDTVARLGGDEFMFVLPGLDEPSGAQRVINAILESSAAAYTLDGQEVFVSASLGVAFCPADGESPEVLMRHADSAMYRSKQRGRNCSTFFSAGSNEPELRAIRLESELRRALENDKLDLDYQPIIKNCTGAINGFEALVRWDHAEFGKVPSEEIIRIAEGSGMIVRLGRWVLEKACRQARQWSNRLNVQLSLAVNVSVFQLNHPDFVNSVESILKATQWPPEKLQLEVIETALLDDSIATRDVLNRLQASGVQWVIDDFGTGYSSLSYIRDFPFTTLKVDRSFIREIPADSNSLKLVKAIVAMAKSFELAVVAEGVENSAQYELLASYGCEFTQGWYFSKALPESQFTEYLKQNRVQES